MVKRSPAVGPLYYAQRERLRHLFAAVNVGGKLERAVQDSCIFNSLFCSAIAIIATK